MLIKHDLNIKRVLTGTWKGLLFSLFTCAVIYYINEIWLSNIFDFPDFVPAVLGTALAFFIGFNNNQAYDRWWEARKIWGALVNDSRTWAREVVNYVQDSDKLHGDDLAQVKREMVKRHIAFLYVLKAFLRKSGDQSYKQYLSEKDLDAIGQHTNKHNAILSQQANALNLLYGNGNISSPKFIEMNKMLTAFSDEMGASERIRNTVFPATYNYYAKAFIWVFIYSATMTMGNNIGVWAVMFGTLLGYVFLTIQKIGQLLVNPFDSVPSGVSLDQITRTIEINLLEMLGEKNIPKPIEVINNEYVM
jgi:ion channel-forming bestrophin family protein